MIISKRIFELTDNLPRKEDYGLTSQIKRSSNSISSNIAEGYGRIHKKDKINFYIFARGSDNETISHLLYGKEVEYFNNKIVQNLIEKIEDTIFDINKIISYIQKQW